MARDYKFEAREALKDFWVISILIALTAILLGGVSLGSLKDSKKNDIEIAHRNAYYNIVEHPMKPGSYYYDFKETGILIIVVMQLIIGGFIELGYNLYNIKLVNRDNNRGFDTLFHYRRYFGNALGLRILKCIYTILWSLLFIIPGIIAAYRYSMATYIMAENPDIAPAEALELSKAMMDGQKWNLFCLHFSFLGWRILSAILTFGIGDIAITAYEKAAEAVFYMNITGRSNYRALSA